MSTKIGRFEILGELAKSDWSAVYKASDPESGQTLALKVLRLDVFGEHAEEVTQRILQEAETTKELDSPNITLVFGAGDIDGQFCAAMEYIQGNSIATMLARKEGFSIWDLLDISRQVCQALDHVHQHNVFHYSLEPAKVMVTWDGTVKILSFGISSTGSMAAVASGAPQNALYYMSPEQISGDPVDARSNLFSWGAILYEMVTDQKAFGGDDADAVRQKILQEMPVAPALVNPRINPVASEVIMKALAKNPAERYQSGREMAADLERCREASSKVTKKAPEPAKGPIPPANARAAAKFASAPPAAAAPQASRPASPAPQTFKVEPAPPVSEELETSWTPPAPPAEKKPAEPSKAAAAAAGWNSTPALASGRAPQIDPSSQFISSVVRASVGAMEGPAANMSAAVADEPAVEQPKIAVDPMMAENAAGSKGPSFSELDELPPLKEVYVAPPVPLSAEPELDEALPATVLRRSEPEKPKIQPREVAEKAIQEIKSLPPRLMMYSISAAVALIVFVSGLVYWRSQSQSTDEEGRVPAQAAAPVKPAPAPVQPPAPVEPTVTQPPVAQEASEEAAPARSVPARNAKVRRKKAAPAPAAIPGQLAVDSTPEGAQIQIDGKSDPNWQTPYTMPGLAAGEHSIVVSKPGYVQEIRTVDVTAAAKTSLVVHLTAQVVSMNVSSDPAGAAIYVDGKDTAKVTPAVISLEKGNHTVLVRKAGFLDETTAANGQPGQTLHFAPRLRPLGNVDDIKTVGKFKKIFGGGGAQAGMSKVSIKTLPKGAQIAINRRILEKTSPVEILLNPGNYIIDITLSGYQPVQKVITIDQGATTVIDETLQTQ
jgi:eukaryotic-like serine/threonine-protein kinase